MNDQDGARLRPRPSNLPTLSPPGGRPRVSGIPGPGSPQPTQISPHTPQVALQRGQIPNTLLLRQKIDVRVHSTSCGAGPRKLISRNPAFAMRSRMSPRSGPSVLSQMTTPSSARHVSAALPHRIRSNSASLMTTLNRPPDRPNSKAISSKALPTTTFTPDGTLRPTRSAYWGSFSMVTMLATRSASQHVEFPDPNSSALASLRILSSMN